MSASFYDLLKYAATGIASPDMTYYDKMRASTLMGGVVKTLTGIPPLSFKSDGTPLISWNMKGNGSQTGTPTPDNPVMPEFVGVRTANLCGVNEWKNAQSTDTRSYFQIGIILYNGSTSLGSKYKSVQTVGAFNLATNATSDTITKIQIKHNGSSRDLMIDEITGNWSAGTVFTVSANCIGNDPTVLNGIDLQNIMLNTGSTAQPYEPFGYKIPITLAGQTQNIYLSEPLRKIGYYADSVSSDGTVTRRIKKLVLTGEEDTIGYSTSGQNARAYFALTDVLASSTGISTHYKLGVIRNYPFVGEFCINNSGAIIFGVDISTITSSADFKAFLASQYSAGTPITIWYVLANPVTETVTVPTLTPTKGSNTLSIGTTLAPSEVSITGGIK